MYMYFRFPNGQLELRRYFEVAACGSIALPTNKSVHPPQQQIKPHYCLLQGNPLFFFGLVLGIGSSDIEFDKLPIGTKRKQHNTKKRKNRRATDSKRPVSSFLVASIRSHTRSSSNVERRRRRRWPFDNDDGDDHELSEPCQLSKRVVAS